MTVDTVVLQLACTIGDVKQNLAQLEGAVAGLETPFDLVVLPELYNTGYDLEVLARSGHDLAETRDGLTVSLVRRLADQYQATIVVGFLEAGEDDELYDSVVVAAPGGLSSIYRKTHLYPAETAHFDAGDSLTTTNSAAYSLGVMICFEHAFPEIASTLALAGAQILAIPSAVPVGYEHLVELRTRARAQDNQLFVVAANQAGNGFCGRSLIAGPRGEVLAQAGPDPTVLRASLDLANIEAERVNEPALRTRRPELYR